MRIVDLQTMWKEEFFACGISSIFQWQEEV